MRTLQGQRDSGKGLGDGVGNRVAHTIERWGNRISEGLKWFGIGLLIIMTLLIVSHAVGRYVFDYPIRGNVELSELILACIAFSGMVYVTAKEGNVRVALIFSHFPKRVQGILESIMAFVGAGLFALVSWQLSLGALDWMRIGRITSTLEIPLFPFRFLAAVLAALICLFLLIIFLRSLGKQS